MICAHRLNIHILSPSAQPNPETSWDGSRTSCPPACLPVFLGIGQTSLLEQA